MNRVGGVILDALYPDRAWSPVFAVGTWKQLRDVSFGEGEAGCPGDRVLPVVERSVHCRGGPRQRNPKGAVARRHVRHRRVPLCWGMYQNQFTECNLHVVEFFMFACKLDVVKKIIVCSFLWHYLWAHVSPCGPMWAHVGQFWQPCLLEKHGELLGAWN